MGDFDIVKAVLDRIGDDALDADRHQAGQAVRLRPARGPTPVPVFGLPGNPVSSLVSFELLARPALRQMMGHRQSTARVPAVADERSAAVPTARPTSPGSRRVRAPTGASTCAPPAPQGSHQLAATAAANALAVVPDGDGVAAGGDVDVLLLA